MNESSEIPISQLSIVESSKVDPIKNLPPTQNVYELLDTYRHEQEFSVNGVWSNNRLHAAAKGLEIYSEVFKNASDKIKAFLSDIYIFHSFIGIRPVFGLGEQDPKTMIIKSHLLKNGVTDNRFLEVREEFEQLLKIYAGDIVRLEKVDCRQVIDKNKFVFQLMNALAVKNVMDENPDVFPANTNPIEWLLRNPSMWPMKSSSFVPDNKNNEIRSGVLSGFPRSASIMFANEESSEVDWLKSVPRIIRATINNKTTTLAKKVEYPHLNSSDVLHAISDSGLLYIHYSEEDFQWTREVAALTNYSAYLIQQKLIKHPVIS